jgi:hypothetical protein
LQAVSGVVRAIVPGEALVELQQLIRGGQGQQGRQELTVLQRLDDGEMPSAARGGAVLREVLNRVEVITVSWKSRRPQ